MCCTNMSLNNRPLPSAFMPIHTPTAANEAPVVSVFIRMNKHIVDCSEG